MKSKLKPILDSQLSGIDWTPEETRNMLRQMKGEPQVKKKISMALALALALMMLALSALAVTLWKNYYDKIAQNEGEIGYFDSWSGEKRAEFVLAMQAEGVNFDKEQIRKLEDKATPDAEKKKIATDLILDKYPGMQEGTITAISILEAEKGPLPGWSMEDKAAYTQMLVKTNTLGYDEEMYWLPGEGDIPQETALKTADAAIKKEFGETDEGLKAMTLYVELRSFADQKEHRTWHVYYMKKGEGVYDAPSQYSVWINARTGEVEELLSPAQQAAEAKKDAPPEHISRMWKDAMAAFREAEPYTLDSLMKLRAEWTDRFAEMKQHTTHWGGMFDIIKNLMEQDIRMPEDGAISAGQAWEKAEAAVLALPGFTKERLAMFGRLAEVYYHSKELGKPVYHMFYSQKRHYWPKFDGKPFEFYEKNYLLPLYALYGGDDTAAPHYVAVRLDAKTGELTEAPAVGAYQKGAAMKMEFELIR